MTRPRLAFVALHAYPLFFPRESGGIFGGTEVRAWRFACELARRNAFDISFIVMDHGQPEQHVNGVRVVPHQGYPALVNHTASTPSRLRTRIPPFVGTAIRKLRFRGDPWRARAFPAWDAYAAADADVYCVFGVSDVAADVVRYCKQARRTSALFVGSDEELSATYRAGSLESNVYGSLNGLCHYSIVNGDAVIVQTDAQKKMAASRFGRDSRIVRNPVELGEQPPSGAGRYVAWIGKSDSVKRPELLIEVARRLPNIEFKMILNASDAQAHRSIHAIAPRNVTTIMDQATIEQSRQFISSAALLVNTSRFEGFANAMLEACAAGVPVVTLAVDPEGFIAASGSGESAGGNFDRFVAAIEALMTDSARRAHLGENAKRYVETRHEVGARAAELEEVFFDLLGGRK